MKETLLKYLIEKKDYWENLVAHAIQNQYNPYAENGTARLKEFREELARINKEINDLVSEGRE